MIAIHNLPTRFSKIHFTTIRLLLGLPNVLFPSYAFLTRPVRATCPVSLIRLDLIILILYGKAYKYQVLYNAALYLYNVCSQKV